VSDLIIRPESADLFGGLRAVQLEAFPTALEADLVDRLRADGDIALALAALSGGVAVGHIVFSNMVAPGRTLGLGPVAVAPKSQGQGIGSRLIREGIESARTQGWEGVFVLGEPSFYGRFGFTREAAAGFASPYAGPYFMALSLTDRPLAAHPGHREATYAPAFSALG